MASGRDTSRDGWINKLQTLALTRFKWFWAFVQSSPVLSRLANKVLINNAIYKVPTRPNAFSLVTLEPFIPGTDDQRFAAVEGYVTGKGIPKQTDVYTSWESLSDRTYTGRHLPPDPDFNRDGNLPELDDLAVLFKKRRDADNRPVTIYSEKSTLLFPYWVQWFTDGFLRKDGRNPLKNTSNHQIDLSPVYGLTPASTHMLRRFEGGKLKSQILNSEEYPLFYYADPENGIVKPEFEGLYDPLSDEKRLDPALKSKLFAMGVERANVQIGYVMLNVLCLREHNRLCEVLAKAYPAWDDERLFQTARNILMVVIMKIVVEEYINHLTPYNFKFFVDPPLFTKEKWYRTNWMTMEFSLVYRWHSALPDNLIYNGQDMPMVTSLWNNQMVIDRGLGSLFEETCTQPAGRIGLFNTDDFLIAATELASIRLGRLAQMASYNDYRAMAGYPRVTDFNQITSDPEAQTLLKALYGNVDRVEFYVGLNAEDVRDNSALAPLIGRLVGIDAFSQALTNPLLSERIFNAQTFSPVGWEIIHSTRSLADLVNRNTPRQEQPYRVTFYR
ncbi:peroxidase family protein [Nodosilinea nodulosa]|uniref:peroxidase family protein n=1 Tax=Nodosilinea nodulosa TaxID=416001 RepID=UPI0003017FDF|nr:peroxidase family protein [Nodosilinea nodulosa]